MTTRLLTLRDVMWITAVSRSAVYTFMLAIQVPEARPHR